MLLLDLNLDYDKTMTLLQIIGIQILIHTIIYEVI